MSNILNIQSDSPIALADVPDLLPRRHGKKIHTSTVYRWATKGVRGRVLGSQMIGGFRYTTITALNRFLAPVADQPRADERARIKQILYGDAN